MNRAETIFSIANSLAFAAWLLLIAAPRWSLTTKLIHRGVIPLLLATAYLVLIVTTFGGAEGDFFSLAGVMSLFRDQWAALSGWIHYLTFDLFIGAWESRDAQERGISHWLLIPCLLLTFFFGPIGLLLYHIVRFFRLRGAKSIA